jgi:hypothetical protein
MLGVKCRVFILYFFDLDVGSRWNLGALGMQVMGDLVYIAGQLGSKIVEVVLNTTHGQPMTIRLKKNQTH